MEGKYCVSLDVPRQYPENEPSDIKCFEFGYLKRYCDLTIIEDVIIRCKAIYMNGSSYCDKKLLKQRFKSKVRYHQCIKFICIDYRGSSFSYEHYNKILSWNLSANSLDEIDVNYTV